MAAHGASDVAAVGPATVAVSAAEPVESALASDVVVLEAPQQPKQTTGPVELDASKLHVYQVALDFHELACGLVPAVHRIVRDQLERASLSICLNVAEGAGHHSRRQKARFYSIARGSAMECAALLDVLRRRRLAPESVLDNARSLVLRVIQMLTKLQQALRR